MNRELLLGGGVAVLLAAALLVAAAVPGVLADPGSEHVRPGHLHVEEMSIAPGEVSGSTATLTVDTRLTHRGGPSENATVLLRAVSTESGMLETTRELPVETVEGEREVSVTGNLTVAREGGYRIEAVVYQDGQRIDQGGKEVQGVGTLEPAYADTPVGFHRFAESTPGADLPVIEYTVADVSDNRTTLDVSAYLTNEGDARAGDLRLVFKVRQADSNIVADEAAVDVGQIRPGRTAAPSASLTVPDGYNYYLDAVLWKDGVVVGTERSVANLDPTETLDVDTTTRDVGLEVSDFERDDRRRGTPTRERAAADTSGQPGFGVAAALVALLAAALVARRNL